MLDNHEADIIRDKIQNIDTTIAVWVGEYIPEQASLEVIEQILLDSSKFQRFDVDQVQLLTIRIKKVSATHTVVPENKKALKAIYQSIPRQS